MYNNFFEVNLKETVNISTLLRYVEEGNQLQVELLLQLNPGAIVDKDTLLSAQHSFPLISAFELAAWNLDIKHMCYAMLYNSLCFLPVEEAEKIQIILLKQAETLDSIGIEDQFKDNNNLQSHYDFSELTNSFYSFLKAFKQWPEDERLNPSEEQNQLWENYSLAQQNAPAHVRQHYNDPDVTFRDPVPDFDLNQFNRTGVALEWGDEQHRGGYSNHKYADKPLARAIIRSKQKDGGRYTTIPQLDFNGGWQKDIIAIEHLRDTRQRNWDEIKALLKKPIREIILILEKR